VQPTIVCCKNKIREERANNGLVYKNRGPVTRSVDCQQNKKRRRGRLPMMFQLFVATRKGSKEALCPTIGRLLTK